MIEKEIKVINEMGLHARPAAILAQTAAKFEAEIKMARRGIEINAKSIMGIMMLAAEHGSILHFTFDGADEDAASETITGLFANKFEEDV